MIENADCVCGVPAKAFPVPRQLPLKGQRQESAEAAAAKAAAFAASRIKTECTSSQTPTICPKLARLWRLSGQAAQRRPIRPMRSSRWSKGRSMPAEYLPCTLRVPERTAAASKAECCWTAPKDSALPLRRTEHGRQDDFPSEPIVFLQSS